MARVVEARADRARRPAGESFRVLATMGHLTAAMICRAIFGRAPGARRAAAWLHPLQHRATHPHGPAMQPGEGDDRAGEPGAGRLRPALGAVTAKPTLRPGERLAMLLERDAGTCIRGEGRQA